MIKGRNSAICLLMALFVCAALLAGCSQKKPETVAEMLVALGNLKPDQASEGVKMVDEFTVEGQDGLIRAYFQMPRDETLDTESIRSAMRSEGAAATMAHLGDNSVQFCERVLAMSDECRLERRSCPEFAWMFDHNWDLAVECVLSIPADEAVDARFEEAWRAYINRNASAALMPLLTRMPDAETQPIDRGAKDADWRETLLKDLRKELGNEPVPAASYHLFNEKGIESLCQDWGKPQGEAGLASPDGWDLRMAWLTACPEDLGLALERYRRDPNMHLYEYDEQTVTEFGVLAMDPPKTGIAPSADGNRVLICYDGTGAGYKTVADAKGMIWLVMARLPEDIAAQSLVSFDRLIVLTLRGEERFGYGIDGNGIPAVQWHIDVRMTDAQSGAELESRTIDGGVPPDAKLTRDDVPYIDGDFPLAAAIEAAMEMAN